MKIVIAILSLIGAIQAQSVYQIGCGKADITGPLAETKPVVFNLVITGLYTRQYSRAFVIQQNGVRIVYVVIDLIFADDALKKAVVEKLSTKYGYSTETVMLAATHTHAHAGGYMPHIFFSLAPLGFTRVVFDRLVDGIVKSVERAHGNLQDGHIYYKSTRIDGAQVNASPFGYEANKDAKSYAENVDRNMHQLTLTSLAGHPIGLINWFGVQPTNMGERNSLTSADNKGLAAVHLEEEFGDDFVAGMASDHGSDSKPHTGGWFCLDQSFGKHAACNIRDPDPCPIAGETCSVVGQTGDDIKDTFIAASLQIKAASGLVRSSVATGVRISGPIAYRHQFVNMENYPINATVSTCPASIGRSMAIAYPSFFSNNSIVGTLVGNPMIESLKSSGAVTLPDEAIRKCQAPKTIFLPTGKLVDPYPWTPSILPTHVIRIGTVLIAGLPADITTMGGRRLTKAIHAEAVADGLIPTLTVVSTDTNAYAGITTTPEEYGVPCFAGSFTIYGPNTLEAYIIQFKKLTAALISGSTVPPGPTPPDFISKAVTFQTGVFHDQTPWFKSFGECSQKPSSNYSVGDTVEVKFWSGHPKNELTSKTLQPTLLRVERLLDDDWVLVADDNSRHTIYEWTRVDPVLGSSKATVKWMIPDGTPSGTYRIRHFGTRKSPSGRYHSYSGECDQFNVI